MRKDYTSISISVELANLITQHIQKKGFTSKGEYIRHLIRQDLKEESP